jgi:hypothetical protein
MEIFVATVVVTLFIIENLITETLQATSIHLRLKLVWHDAKFCRKFVRK